MLDFYFDGCDVVIKKKNILIHRKYKQTKVSGSDEISCEQLTLK